MSFLKKNVVYNDAINDKYIKIESIIDSSDNIDDIVSQLKVLENEIESSRYPLRYKSDLFYFVLIFNILVSTVITYFSGFFYIFFIIVPLSFLLKAKKYNTDIIKDKLIDKKIKDNYNYSNNFMHGAQDSDSIVYNFREYFSLGNYDNSIDQVISGNFEFQDHLIPYSVFRYNYKKVISDGRNNTEIYSYVKHGVILFDVDIHSFSVEKNEIRSRYKIDYDVSDLEFNEEFRIKGLDEMYLSKIFTPYFTQSLKKLLKSDLGISFLISNDKHPILVFDFEASNIFQITYESNNMNSIQNIIELIESISWPDYDRFLKNKEMLSMFYKKERR